MTAAADIAAPQRRGRAAGAVARLAVAMVLGTLAATTPVTSLIALGWLTRRMGASVRAELGEAVTAPGWIMGPSGRGAVTRVLGGLAQNVSAGAGTLAGLLAWTLPVTALWLGAWWAGWENSFGKGYEQAWVGPTVFIAAAFLSLPLLSLLPIAMAHAAAEGRATAMADLRRIRAAARHATWRVPLIAALTLAAGLPVLALRVLPVMQPDLFGPVEDLTPAAVAEIRANLNFLGAAWSFAALMVLRHLAARAYARAAPRAAAADPALWSGTLAGAVPLAAGRPTRVVVAVCTLLAWAFTAGFALTILVGQFASYAWWRWLTQPAYLLPWAG